MRRQRSARACTRSAIEPFEVKLDAGESTVAAARSCGSGSLHVTPSPAILPALERTAGAREIAINSRSIALLAVGGR